MNGFDAGYVGYNEFFGGAVYPGGGDTAGLAATSPGPAMGNSNPGGVVTAGTMNAFSGNPITGAIVFLALVVIIMFVVHRFGREQADFGNIRGSAYNAGFIGLCAAAGLPVIKFGFGKLAEIHVPFAEHVFAYVNGA